MSAAMRPLRLYERFGGACVALNALSEPVQLSDCSTVLHW